MVKRIWFIGIVCMVLGIGSLLHAASRISGTIVDSQSNDPLPGANIVLEGTNLGAAADIEGNYTITRVPPGNYTLRVTYIGYENMTIDINVPMNKDVKQNISMDYTVLVGENVVITAQAEGQMSAINQQIAARTIKNVVSKDKIQELPEANAAEALGRLPGISLDRSGGEGQRVTIRGISPEHNKIQVDGVSMAATGGYDRSTNLSMISPYMLEGIEVTKAAMANQEADVIGGTVNFKLKNAPNEPTLNLLVQPGYNSLAEEVKDYKYVAGGSKRFFNNLFGVFAQVDFERRNRSSDYMSANYGVIAGVDDKVKTLGTEFNDRNRIVNRAGGTIVLDYQGPSTNIMFSNLLSKINIDQVTRNEGFQYGMYKAHDLSLNDDQSENLIMTNSLRLEQYWGSLKIKASLFHSFSENETPESITFMGGGNNVYDGIVPGDIHPGDITNYLKPRDELLATEFIREEFLNSDSYYTKERNYGGKLDFEFGYDLGNWGSVNINTGLQYKTLSREYDREAYYSIVFTQAVRQTLWDYMNENLDQDVIKQWVPGETLPQRFPWAPFIDPDYDPGNFLAGNYSIGNQPYHDFVVGLEDRLKSLNQSTSQFKNMTNSDRNDYHGDETYYAAYFMPEFQFGKSITFIPGVRYEHNKTDYFGVRGRANTNDWQNYQHLYDTNYVRENDYLLPMIHLVTRLNDKYVIRSAFTQTLSRPTYWEIIPAYDHSNYREPQWRNPALKPAFANNVDLQLSTFSNKVGLVSVGGFYKHIKDFIYDEGKVNIRNGSNATIADSIRLYNQYDGLPPWEILSTGYFFWPVINNPNPAEVWGFETEWQANFWFLPGALRGLVFNINYTRSFSETTYDIHVEEDSTYFVMGTPFTKKVLVDTSYTERLVNQPDHLLNITIGFDYKGFSIRTSMRYTSDIFTGPNMLPQLRSSTADFTRYDVSVKQQLPLKGLRIYGNVSNLTGNIEKSYNNVSGYPTYESWYGTTVDVGLEYRY